MKVLNKKQRKNVLGHCSVVFFAFAHVRRRATAWFMIHSGSLRHWRSQSHMLSCAPRDTISSYVTIFHAPSQSVNKVEHEVPWSTCRGWDQMFLLPFSALGLWLNIHQSICSHSSEKKLFMMTFQTFASERKKTFLWNCLSNQWRPYIVSRFTGLWMLSLMLSFRF